MTVDEPRVSTAHRSPPAVVAFLLAKLPPGRVLNLGAGGGAVTGTGAAWVVDVDHVAPADAGGAPFVVADARALPFRPGAFGGALLMDVIEHVDDPIAVLTEVRHAVRPAGEVVVTVPRAIARAVWDDPTHVRGFTAHALVQALDLAGWRPLRPPRRFGGLPGAGRLGLLPYLEGLLRIPGLGHWYGTNWLVHGRRA